MTEAVVLDENRSPGGSEAGDVNALFENSPNFENCPTEGQNVETSAEPGPNSASPQSGHVIQNYVTPAQTFPAQQPQTYPYTTSALSQV